MEGRTLESRKYGRICLGKIGARGRAKENERMIERQRDRERLNNRKRDKGNEIIIEAEIKRERQIDRERKWGDREKQRKDRMIERRE